MGGVDAVSRFLLAQWQQKRALGPGSRIPSTDLRRAGV